MKRKTLLSASLLWMFIFGVVGAQVPLATSFTYQGQLNQTGKPAQGTFDMDFYLYDDPDPLLGTVIGVEVLPGVVVDKGLFTVELDFGAVFHGDAYWLEIQIWDETQQVYVPLEPLQPLRANPYSLYSLRSGVADTAAIASDANTLDGLDSTAFAQVGTPTTGDLEITGTVAASAFELNGEMITSWPFDSPWSRGTGTDIFYDGNVGIGTSNPAAGLHVSVDSAGWGGRIYNSEPEGGGLQILASSEANEAALSVANYDGTQEFLQVNGVGNVSIGQVNATADLHIQGNLSNPLSGTVTVGGGSDVVNGVGTAFMTEVRVGDAILVGSETFAVRQIDSDTVLFLSAPHSAGSLNSTAFVDSDLLAVLSGSGNSAFTINKSGDVSIGPFPPGSRLQVVKSFSSPDTIERIASFGRETSSSAAGGIGGKVDLTAVNPNTSGLRTAASIVWGWETLNQPFWGVTGFEPNVKPEPYRIYINGDGFVGIATEAPDFTLHVNGSAGKPGGGSWSTASDRRLKDLHGDFSRGLTEIAQLAPVRYRYSEGNPLHLPTDEQYVGLVAQDVAEVIPEAVVSTDDGFLYLNNDPILWAMLNAIKELRLQNDRIKTVLCHSRPDEEICRSLE